MSGEASFLFTGSGSLELLSQVLQFEPRVKAGRPDVNPWLDAVVSRCLAKDPAARYPDGAALLDDLEAILRGEAPPTLALQSGPRIAKWAAAAHAVLLFTKSRWNGSTRNILLSFLSPENLCLLPCRVKGKSLQPASPRTSPLRAILLGS